MQVIEDTFENESPLYNITDFCDTDKCLYIDIETTGLSKEKTTLYLIGCGYYKNNNFITKLFFADSPDEELDLLNLFIDFSKNFTHLIHFNGTKFDIPYLTYKAEKYNLGDIFQNLTQVDVYQLSKPLRYLLFPTSMRQKCIEDFLGITRDDKFNGGELINVYHSYVKTKSYDYFLPLITHNKEDVLGMHKIMPILHYLKLLDCELSYDSYQIEQYTDFYGEEKKEVIFHYFINAFMPKSFTSKTDTMYLRANSENKMLSFRLPIYASEMKMFFDNYKDYYYLIEEDSCIHKSVAMGLSKDKYKKATKELCYQKCYGNFVKEPDKLFHPIFKQNYKDKASYFKFPDSFDTEHANEFGRALLDVYIKKRR